MPRRVLIAARTSPLLSELAAAAAEAGLRVVMTDTGEKPGGGAGREAPSTESASRDNGAERPAARTDWSGEGLRTLSWNPRSPVSARAVVMKSANLEGGFDTAVVVCNPDRHGAALSETPGGAIEDTIDASVKGGLFILKELAAHLEKRGGGSLALISVASEATQAPLDATATGAFEALGESLFLATEGTNLSVRGFRFQGGDRTEFVRFVFEQLLEDSRRGMGKWLRYTGRSRLLSLGL
ncbi:MAG: hypothetical protein ACOCYC_03385 [bacterium]